MDFLRDSFWEFIISTFISIAGIIIPILIGIFQSKSSSGSSSTSISPSSNPTGCWIVPTVIVSILLIIFILFFGTAFVFISNAVSTVFHTAGTAPTSFFNSSPDQVLDNYCSGIQSGAFQEAYDQYSNRLKGEVSSAQFTQMWSDKHLGSCTHDAIHLSGNSATTTLTTQDFFTKQVQSYSVTLIQDGSNGWKIDSIQAQ